MRIIILFLVLCVKGVPVSSVYSSEKAGELRKILFFSYDSKVRPQETTQVKIGLNILSIKELNSIEQTLSATVWFTVAWNDTRLDWVPASYDDINTTHAMEGEPWRPELVVSNTVADIAVLADEYQLYRITSDGTVVWEPTRYTETHCQMDMTYYPFDIQRCPITISTWSLNEAEMKLISIKESINLQLYEENSEWELDASASGNIAESTYSETVNDESRSYSRVTFYVTLQRRTAFYGLNIFLPLVLLSLMSGLVFVLPVEAGEKASYSVTMLLAVVVFFGVILSYLPISQNTPLLAVYVSMVLLLSTLSILLSFWVVCIHHRSPSRQMSHLMHTIGLILAKFSCQTSSDDDDHGDLDSCKLDEKPEKPPLPIGNTTWMHHALPPRQLPPVEPILKRNKSRPGSLSSVQTTKSDGWTKVHKFHSDITWRAFANNLDHFFLLMYAAVSVLIHFIFVMVIGLGGR